MKNTKFKTKIVASTCGGGLWSSHQKTVAINHIQIYHIYKHAKKDSYTAELRAFFNSKDWPIGKLGLIYTDRQWLKQFREGLMKSGFSKKAVNSVDYSEQGMQGDNYVSLDVGDHFIKEFAVIKQFGKIEEI